MIDRTDRMARLLLLLVSLLIVSGCGMVSSYRPADKKTIGDFSGNGDYLKTVGILALSNTTRFTSPQIASPFLETFMDGLKSAAPQARLLLPEDSDGAPFLWNPPRIANGDIDVFRLAGLARQAGMNAVVSPILMDIRVRKKDTGFWFFHDVAYSLQIQTAAAIYDAITGARLDLGILTDEVDIDEDLAGIINSGQEASVDDLVEVAEEMGDKLGERMGDALKASKWLTSVVAIEDGACVVAAGEAVGIAAGDRFSLLDGSGVIIGLDGQRFIVPGTKIGELTIRRVAPRWSFGIPESGELPPVGSVLVPGD